MATEVILPRVDMDMVEGKIAHWYVKEGEPVKKGQVLFEIETDKATMEVDATADGVLHGIRGEIGVAMPVGEVVGWILAPGEVAPGADVAAAPTDEQAVAVSAEHADAAASEGAPTPAFSEAAAPADRLAVTGVQPNTPADGAGRLRATPLARSLAREHGIDLSAVPGSGPNGRIVGSDLAAARETAAAAVTTTHPGAARDPVHLQWMRRGSGTPLVLIHGFGADHGSWRPLLQQLPEGFPVIGIDLPNHGKSAALSARTMQDLAHPVLERLDQEGVIGFHLLGHSLGGGVALSLAPMAAERLRSLTLLAPAGLGDDINAAFIDGLTRADDEATLRSVLVELFHRPALLTGSFVATAFQQIRAPQRRAALAELAQHLMPRGRQSQSLRELLDGLRVPVQIIWGAADRVIPVQQALGAPPHVGLHLLPAVGHLPQVEAAVLVGALASHQVRHASAAA